MARPKTYHINLTEDELVTGSSFLMRSTNKKSTSIRRKYFFLLSGELANNCIITRIQLFYSIFNSCSSFIYANLVPIVSANCLL